MKNTIKPSQHVFIAGGTGSGKSYIAERYLAGPIGNVNSVVMLDSKLEMWQRREDKQTVWSGLTEKQYTFVHYLEDLPKAKTDKIIFAPLSLDFYEDIDEGANMLCKWIFERKNTILWLDELTSVNPTPQRIPRYLKALWHMGRTKNTSVWALTQRPSGITQSAFSQSSQFFILSLNKFDDRQVIVKNLGSDKFYQVPPKYAFWYMNQEMVDPVLAKLVIK